MGANALHIANLTGSIEVGKRADLILIDISALHNTPRFNRDHNNIYAQLVYAAKSHDVSDVMVNGKWLMRNRELTTINDSDLYHAAQEYARRIDAYLIKREESVLSKLIAIGGAAEAESFEVQVKVRIQEPEPVLNALNKPGVEILHKRHYHEFDTYFLFSEADQGSIRYREDEYIDDKGAVSNIRYRLTLLGQAREGYFPSDVVLSRSRFIAPATHSLRFYREYFKPIQEKSIEKNRLRWRVLFQGTEFYINLDKVEEPNLGYFLEVKSRTWSKRDAEYKAQVASNLIEFLGASLEETIAKDYLELI